MRVQSRHHLGLVLLIHYLAASAALASSVTSSRSTALEETAAVPKFDAGASSLSGSVGRKYDVGTKDAPVDGLDGRPREGPFVEVDNLRKNPKYSSPSSHHDEDITAGAAGAGTSDKTGQKPLPLKDQPVDLTFDKDGNKIPKSNDGVMDDKNRPEPKVGTTGTSGGVSEKDKERKKIEGQTGERVENKPETPKEAPPLPHSEQKKISGENDRKKQQEKGKDDVKATWKITEDVSGLEKPADLPGRPTDQAPPLPKSANKDHLEVDKGAKSSSKLPSMTPEEGNEGLIQPLHSFLLSLTMILFSEVGDKTFLVAALMAMKHDRMVVFSAAFSALVTMTVLSAVLGHTVPTLISRRLTSFLAAGLFFVFGARLLREGLAMSPDEGVSAEMHEVELELEEKEKLVRRRGSSISPYALEMGLAGGPAGNSGARKSRSNSRFPTPPRSPSSSPEGRSRSPPPRGALAGGVTGLNNLLSLLLSPAWVQTFIMTFLGEWGDRSQIATIAMAAGQDYWWVTLGAVLGHACCTGVAVIGGRAIAGRVSLKVVTVGGAVAFLVFGSIYLIEAFYA